MKNLLEIIFVKLTELKTFKSCCTCQLYAHTRVHVYVNTEWTIREQGKQMYKIITRHRNFSKSIS